ncbi:hypothetical protein [Planococcus donghaensis]|uniref:hypothetical protein n=1 Tax=Planococcus donghaensis TaxID=414778 RepID=UPI0012EB3E91|nr:hypothetical protein [Planococcus donghaensis]
MKYNSSLMDGMIRLAIKNQFDIQGKRLTKDDVIALALHDLIKEQEKTLKKGYANMCK